MIKKDYGKYMRLINENMDRLIALKLENYGINQGQFEYFLMIFMYPGINQLALAERKFVSKASVTKAIKILEKDGFVKRKRDEGDRRSFLLYLTDKGEQITDDLMSIKNRLEKELFNGFSDSDQKKFFEYLETLEKNSRNLIEKEKDI